MFYRLTSHLCFMQSTLGKSFQVVWMVGFFWCFLLKYPPSLSSLFLRRCQPIDATYVSVVAPIKQIDTLQEKKCITNFFGVIKRSASRMLNFIYSIETYGADSGNECRMTYCKVISGK